MSRKGMYGLSAAVPGVLTYLTNLYFRIKNDRHKTAKGE
ncbi:TPA: hypothetical protein UZ441_004600 [Escherichia coli]|nr:hypothetical protein [Escherichia coli]HEL8044523.1 hypothetical protein [Escherichia coli]HEL8049395.1 hypothetical protein [Escherichia coli]HEL8054177.1 hypothetical protein [Escherichia coli]HEL8059018.1 hypothetical protein [Escherichia coli]